MTKTKTAAGPKQRILDAASDLFYRQGYLATGINQVIEQAGVAKASFYQHFPSKEDLCVAYLRERHHFWMQRFKSTLKEQPDPYKKIVKIFSVLETWLPECKYRGCAFVNIASEIPDQKNEIRKVVIEHKQELKKLFKSIIQDLKKSSEKYSKISVPLLTDALYLLFEGAVTSSQSFNSVWPVDSARKSFDALLKGK